MTEIEFVPVRNLKKYPTKGSVEWLTTLKARWDLKYTEMTDNESDIIVIFHEKSRSRRSVYVGYYDKVSKMGCVSDRRGEIRCN